jgi:hypothetical protein
LQTQRAAPPKLGRCALETGAAALETGGRPLTATGLFAADATTLLHQPLTQATRVRLTGPARLALLAVVFFLFGDGQVHADDDIICVRPNQGTAKQYYDRQEPTFHCRTTSVKLQQWGKLSPFIV